jgi:hypothetical protein
MPIDLAPLADTAEFLGRRERCSSSYPDPIDRGGDACGLRRRSRRVALGTASQACICALLPNPNGA